MTSQVVPVQIAGELVIRIGDLPETALELIKSALTFPNEEREKKAREKVMGWWDLPETFSLYRIEQRRGGDHVICLPRGFAMGLGAGLAQQGLSVQWDDQRVKVPAADGYYRPFVLRDYQLAAAVDLMKAQQGFYKCPAGGGKTVTILGFLAWISQRAIIVVDKAGLVEQWRLRAHQFYGMPIDVDEDGNEVASLEGERTVGKIGEDVWEERDLTICLRQTLHARGWAIDAAKWWGKLGATVFDEGHHLGADTMQEMCRKAISFYLCGTSATPARSETHGRVVHSLVGPIVHETPRQVLYDRGVLMKPRVQVLTSDFEAIFWDTHDSLSDGSGCQVPNCAKAREGKKHMHRNNYQSVQKKLLEHKPRLRMIAQRIASDRGHVHLVNSRQLKLLGLIEKELVEAGWPAESIFYLRGEENARGESQKIVQTVQRSHEAVILSTVADEAMDIPPIDRVHLPFPMRSELLVIQSCGRGERVWPGKTESVIVDYHDPGCVIFGEQHEQRLRVYRMQGYEIHHGELPMAAPAEAVTLHEREDGATEFRVPTGHVVVDDEPMPSDGVMLG